MAKQKNAKTASTKATKSEKSSINKEALFQSYADAREVAQKKNAISRHAQAILTLAQLDIELRLGIAAHEVEQAFFKWKAKKKK